VQQQISNLTAPEGYRPQALDTSIEADLLDFYKLRQLSVTERVEYAADLMTKMRGFSLACLSQQFAHLPLDEFATKVAQAWLQEDSPLGYAPKGNKMSWIQNSPELAIQLHDIFEQANVPYFVVGGVAAIAYGDPRTTRDLDVIVQIAAADISRLKTVLEQSGFYVAGGEDEPIASLQITNQQSIARADLIIATDDEYSQTQFDRRRRYDFLNMGEVYLASPEDIVIGKLRWGLQSESEKQQKDVMAIFKVQQASLDYQYLYHWAKHFDLAEELEALTTAAGVKEIADRQTF
jgi:hypothetical protein